MKEIKIPVEGTALAGMLSLPKNATGTVVFAHGSGSSRFSPRNNYVARVLNESGFGTLLMDLMTPGEDQDYEKRFDISLLTKRLVEATRWLRLEQKPLKIGYFGASTGAAAALNAAAVLGDGISAVVSRGGRPDLARSDSLEKVEAPTLLIVGGMDGIVIELNEKAYKCLHCEKKLTVIPGATHLFEEEGKLEQVASLASAWFEEHMADKPPLPA